MGMTARFLLWLALCYCVHVHGEEGSTTTTTQRFAFGTDVDEIPCSDLEYLPWCYRDDHSALNGSGAVARTVQRCLAYFNESGAYGDDWNISYDWYDWFPDEGPSGDDCYNPCSEWFGWCAIVSDGNEYDWCMSTDDNWQDWHNFSYYHNYSYDWHNFSYYHNYSYDWHNFGAYYHNYSYDWPNFSYYHNYSYDGHNFSAYFHSCAYDGPNGYFPNYPGDYDVCCVSGSGSGGYCDFYHWDTNRDGEPNNSVDDSVSDDSWYAFFTQNNASEADAFCDDWWSFLETLTEEAGADEMTFNSTEAPTTGSPTEAPTTGSPTVAPTTGSPTAAPVTESAESVSGSMVLSSDAATRDTVCSVANLAVGGGTWQVVASALNSSTDFNSDQLDALVCDDARRMRDGRRLQDVVYTITYTVGFDDLDSAAAFVDAVASGDMGTEFASQALSILNVEFSSVSTTVPVVNDKSSTTWLVSGVLKHYVDALVGIAVVSLCVHW